MRPLESGPYLRTVLAHEYMHAVLFGQKGRGGNEASGAVQEEEGWLDEALAHLAEDSCGFSRANIDYRVRAFLARPERYQLVVDDYYAADLFRSHGNRGSTYLFLKWCAGRYGPSLLPDLVASRTCGTANLEACTGAAFAELYRGWTLDLVGHSLARSEERQVWSKDQLSHLENQPGPEDWGRGGPRLARVAAGAEDRWEALGTTCHYVIVDRSKSGAVEIEVNGPTDALQVTAVLLGGGRPGLECRSSKTHGVPTVSIFSGQDHGDAWRARQAHADLMGAALLPESRRGSRASRGSLDATDLQKALGSVTLAASGELTSQAIHLTGCVGLEWPLVVKVGGVDSKGHRVWAWADLDR